MTVELMGINLTNRLRDLKHNIQQTNNDYNNNNYYYALGLDTAKKLCMERGFRFGSKRKGHKLGEVWGVEVLYDPLIESNEAYILRKIDYEINKELNL